jgi:hypothetical protein
MIKISFQLTDDSKLPAIMAWLNNLGVAHNIKAEPEHLSAKQRDMKKNLETSLDWVQQHQRGEVESKSAYDLLKELEVICEKTN